MKKALLVLLPLTVATAHAQICDDVLQTVQEARNVHYASAEPSNTKESIVMVNTIAQQQKSKATDVKRAMQAMIWVSITEGNLRLHLLPVHTNGSYWQADIQQRYTLSFYYKADTPATTLPVMRIENNNQLIAYWTYIDKKRYEQHKTAFVYGLHQIQGIRLQSSTQGEYNFELPPAELEKMITAIACMME